MKRICHLWSRGRHFSPSLPGDKYLKLRSQKRLPDRNLGEHRSVRGSGTASRGTALFVFRLRMRNSPRAKVLTTFEGNNNTCLVGYRNVIDAFARFTVYHVTRIEVTERERARYYLNKQKLLPRVCYKTSEKQRRTIDYEGHMIGTKKKNTVTRKCVNYLRKRK